MMVQDRPMAKFGFGNFVAENEEIMLLVLLKLVHGLVEIDAWFEVIRCMV